MKALALALLAVVLVHTVMHRKPPVPKPGPVYLGYSAGRWCECTDCAQEGMDAQRVSRPPPNGWPNRGRKYG